MSNEFGVASVLNKSFSTYFRNFLPFTAIAYAVNLPLTIWLMWVGERGPETVVTPVHWLTFAVGIVLSLTLSLVMTASVVYGVFQQLHGVPVRVADCLRAVLRRFWVVAAASLATGIIIVIASVFLIIPGIIAAATFFVVVPAVVVEGLGVGASVDRSRDLTAGKRWPLVEIIIVLGVISIVVSLVASRVGVLLMNAIQNAVIVQLIDSLVTTTSQALNAVAAGVAYYLLRVDKEGFEIHDLAEVFA